MSDDECRHGYDPRTCPYCMLKLREKLESLEKENTTLKALIKELHTKIDAKNQTINRLQRDSWDDVTNDRDR